jgi:transposase-like protein
MKKRMYTKDFKAGVVNEILTKNTTASEMATLHNIRPNIVSRWVREAKNASGFAAETNTKMTLKNRLGNLRKELEEKKSLVVELTEQLKKSQAADIELKGRIQYLEVKVIAELENAKKCQDQVMLQLMSRLKQVEDDRELFREAALRYKDERK